MMMTAGSYKRKRSREEMLEDFIAAYEYLKSHKDCNGHIGVVGFCFGGWIANMMAVKIQNSQFLIMEDNPAKNK
jgi:dienelactone hydrolase